MKVAVLASGSSGNSTWVAGGRTSVIVDAGISCRRAGMAAESLGLDLGSLGAVLVTHEHLDHISGLGPLSRKHGVPVYATRGTHGAVAKRTGKCGERVVVESGTEFVVGDLFISAFTICHDGEDPVGYSITDGVHRVVVATDMGVVSHSVREHMSAADCLVLEFNHDERMLMDGSYPWFLKQRIMGREGHLSNEAAARELVMLADGPMSSLVLAHLSRENNRPDLAMETASEALRRAGRSDVTVLLSDQKVPLGPICLGCDDAVADMIATGAAG
ncbi:MAG: MBL fold metallo-hydrolase [Candidatus Eisenbacteria bacterium]|nr:MBL fold metallo-hydrolase [Candidatus Eisenbacteria bacterium]